MSGLSSWAKVGALVVCVDASCDPGRSWDASEKPVEGQIYTISRAWVRPNGRPHVDFAELKRCNLALLVHGDVGYHVRRFRPLVENASDSEVEAAIYRRTKQRKTQRIPHHGPVS